MKKVLIAIIFVTGLVIGVLVGVGLSFFLVNKGYDMSDLPGLTPAVSVTPVPLVPTATPIPEVSPSEAVQGFLSQYEDCLKNPPEAAEGQVSVYCQSNNSFSSGNFVANLKEGGTATAGADLVFCDQDLPESYQIGTPTINGITALIKVMEVFGVTTVEPVVSLYKESSGWKVDDVICPRQNF